MGISSLTSHLSGQKHSEIASLRKSQTGAVFFRKEPQSGAAESRSTKVTKVEDLVIPACTIWAEILWTLKVVTSHLSLRSCLGLNELFEIMFRDSKVVKSFQLSKTKCVYFITYGLAPYVKELLMKNIQSSPFFVLSFDESLNIIIQKEQMDLQVRFWDNEKKKVCTRYHGSKLVQRPNAKNLCDVLIFSLKDLSAERLIQLSVDGPSTNWCVLQLLNDDREEKGYPQIINIGSCGLRVMHRAFKAGMEAAGWNVGKVLKSMWQLFHDSPARRETYARICESEIFPVRCA